MWKSAYVGVYQLLNVAVQITQTDCCDVYCYGMNCAMVGCNK